MKNRTALAEQAARLLRSHVAGENVDDLMHHWADEWGAVTGEPYDASADQPTATETRCRECHMTSQHKLQCSRRNEPLADQPASQGSIR